MGYYTKFDLDFQGSVEEKDIVKALANINPNYFDMYRTGITEEDICLDMLFEEEMKWYDATHDMIQLSEKFPDVIFTLEGHGEEFGDVWREYYKNGACQHCKGTITFEDMDLQLLGVI